MAHPTKSACMDPARIKTFATQVIAILREAGEENLPAIVNSLVALNPDEQPSAIVEIADTMLQALLRAKLVTIASRFPITSVELAAIFPIEKNLLWDAKAGRWRWNETVAPDRPLIVLRDPRMELDKHTFHEVLDITLELLATR